MTTRFTHLYLQGVEINFVLANVFLPPKNEIYFITKEIKPDFSLSNLNAKSPAAQLLHLRLVS